MINEIEKEIKATNKLSHPIPITLHKHQEGYIAYPSSDLVEGEYLLNAKDIIDTVVHISKKHGYYVINGIESEKEKIDAFITKDKSTLLKALKSRAKRDTFIEEPFFIIGPPGTGKTKVITKITEEAVKNGLRILVVSPTHMAIENVFEKFNFSETQLKDGDITVAIKTEKEELSFFAPESIKERQINLIKDEIEILQMALKDILTQKRDIEPLFFETLSKQEAGKTLLQNLSKDISSKEKELKSVENKIRNLEMRAKMLLSNTFLKNIANIFLKKKEQEIFNELESYKTKALSLKNDISKTKKKISSIKEKNTTDEKTISSIKEKMDEIIKIKRDIEKEIEKLENKLSKAKKTNIFATAKIVGTTLMSASLNHQIQNAEFDMIIVDEASMALVPNLIVCSQALSDKSLPKINVSAVKTFTDMQNKAIKEALKRKLILVGDPRQLGPIAITDNLKESVFAKYKIEEIFKGKTVKNCVLLDINFRNHPEIVTLSSNLFYNGLLKSGKKNMNKRALYIKQSFSKMTSKNGSFVNFANATIVKEQIASALSRGRRSIGVITPFKEQAKYIKNSIKDLCKEYPDADLQIGTIHKFQGKEKEIIIFDLTFSPTDTKNLPAIYDGDIFSEAARLLNVATTRAEEFFVLIGDIMGIKNLDIPDSVLKTWVMHIDTLKQVA